MYCFYNEIKYYSIKVIFLFFLRTVSNVRNLVTWPGTAQTEEKMVLDKAGVDTTGVAGVKVEAAR